MMLVIASILLYSCNVEETYDQKRDRSLKQFDSLITGNAKSLINSFLVSNKIPTNKLEEKISGGFYCMWKRRNIDIYPYLALNEIFKKNGYPITLSKDSLKYIIICETKSYNVGTYSNGAKAKKIETIVSVIDIKNEKTYFLARNMGGDPPNSIRGGSVGIGDFWNDENIYSIISNMINKNI